MLTIVIRMILFISLLVVPFFFIKYRYVPEQEVILALMILLVSFFIYDNVPSQSLVEYFLNEVPKEIKQNNQLQQEENKILQDILKEVKEIKR